MTANETIPQRDALRLYLVMVAGREPTGSYFEIRAKRLAGGMDQDFIPLHDAERAARILLNRGQLADTYIGVAPRTERKGSLDAIQRVWCLHADCDSRDSLRVLAAFAPLPSIVVRSGGDDHAHAYWALRTPVSPAWAKRANQRLALAVGADRNATDAARVMRPPGTFNRKHGERRPVVCTRLEPVVFELGDVVGELVDDPAYRPRPRAAPPRKQTPRSAVFDGLVAAVRGAQVGNRNSVLFWAAKRLADRQLHTPEARELLRAAAGDAGLGEREIDQTLSSALDRPVAA